MVAAVVAKAKDILAIQRYYWFFFSSRERVDSLREMSNIQQTHHDTRGARQMAKNSSSQDREERRAETTAHNLLAAEFFPEF